MTRIVSIALCLSLGSSIGIAQERPTAALHYEEPGGACPSEQGFRDVVAGRMGYDPFTAGAATSVDARVEETSEGFIGRVIIRESGELVGERVLSSPAGECQELVESMAVAVSIVLDPFGTASPDANAPAPDPEPQPNPEPDPPESTDGVHTRVWAGDPNNVAFPLPPLGDEEPEERSEDEPIDARVTLHGGVFVGLGTAPRVTLGPMLGAGVRFKHISLLIDGRLDAMVAPHTTALNDEIRATVFTAGPTLCGHLGIAIGCAGAQFGAFQGRSSSVLNPRTVSTFVAFADISGGVGIPLTPILELRALLELRVPLVRTSLTIEGLSVWDAPAAAGTLRIDLAITI